VKEGEGSCRWHLPALGNGATDTAAGSINLMFDFNQHQDHDGGRLLMNPAKGTIAKHR
jgi:hypothetical protein